MWKILPDNWNSFLEREILELKSTTEMGTIINRLNTRWKDWT